MASGTYRTLIPLKVGYAPSELVTTKVLVANDDKGVRGSFNNLRVSFPVLVIVVTTSKSSTFDTASGADTLTFTDRVAAAVRT